MKVKFIGETQTVKAWLDEHENREYTINNGVMFKSAIWGGISSILNEKDEWICDVDSQFFRDNFEILTK